MVEEVKSNSSKRVTVACKLPHGIILQLVDMVEHREAVMGGGYKETKVAQRRDDKVHIKGWATPFGQPPSVLIEGGYALTSNVDADFWNEWVKQNKGSALLKNKMIFAMDRTENAQAKAKEQKEVRSGAEPLDVSRKIIAGKEAQVDPRFPRPTGNITLEHGTRS